MAIKDILQQRAQHLLYLLLSDSGYDVEKASVGEVPFFIASSQTGSFAVALSMKGTLKAARVGGNEFKELQKLLTTPMLQVNAFCSASKDSVAFVTPSILQLVKKPVRRDNVTVETLPEEFDIEYIFEPLKDYDPTREIVVRWSIDDVQQCGRPDLTDAEAWQVLGEVYRYRRQGIDAPCLKMMADYMFEPRTLPCTLFPEGDEANPVPAILELSTGAVMTQKDVDDYAKCEGFTYINGPSGRVTQVRPDVPPAPGKFTLPAFGEEVFVAEGGFIGDYPNDEDACIALRKRLETLGPLADITRKKTVQED